MCYWDCVDYVRMELRELKINDDNIKTKIWTSIIVLQLYNLFQPDIVGRDRRRKKPPRIERK